ncbi:MAG: hypothetical protein IKL20_02755 [Alistipes sp.]|nr:hypothetical protein [Alistipes sp.]
MKRALLILLLFVNLSAAADERGEKRLQRISQHYAALGNYAVSFLLRTGGAEQRGTVQVSGKESYLKVADTEVFITDSLRYEVRGSAREVIVDRADAYEKELLNSLNGFSNIAADYNIEECEVEGRAAVRLMPKKQGEVIYVITGTDGESVAKLRYGSGDNLVEVIVLKSEKISQKLPIFSKERYKGFELIDFR